MQQQRDNIEDLVWQPAALLQAKGSLIDSQLQMS